MTTNLDSKTKRCARYVTQYRAVFGSQSPLEIPERYYQQDLVGLDNSLPKLLWKAWWLSPKDTLHNVLNKPSQPSIVKPYPPTLTKHIQILQTRLKKVVPKAIIRPIGSSDLQIDGQGDIDMIVGVTKAEFVSARAQITRLLGEPTIIRHHIVQWKRKYRGVTLDLDLLLVTHQRYHTQIKINDIMHEYPEVVAQYQAIKASYGTESYLKSALKKIILFETLLKKQNHVACPYKIEAYTFQKPLTVQDAHSGAKFASYQNNRGDRAVLKLATSRKNNAGIRHEATILRQLDALRGEVQVPRLLATGEYDGMTYILTSKVQGSTPSKYSIIKQIEIYSKIIKNLRGLDARQLVNIPVYRSSRWLLGVPFLIIRAWWVGTSLGTTVRLAWYILQHSLVLWSRREIVVTHRDLKADNVLVNNEHTYVLDNELMCLADPAFEDAALYYQYSTDAAYIRALEQSKHWRVYRNDSNQRALCGYLAILTLYNLGSRYESREKTHAVMKALNIQPRRAGLHTWWGTILTFCFAAIILAFSLRGNWGVPTDQDLNDATWKENGPFELSPERGRFALTYSLVENHTSFFTLPLARFTTPDLGYANGNFVSLFAPAVSYLAVPGYLIGKMIGVSQVGAFATSAIFALANAYLIFRLVVRFSRNHSAAVLAGLGFLFLTPAYAYAVNLYQHHISTFFILLTLNIVSVPVTWWSLALVWLCSILAITVDYPNAILMTPIALVALTKIMTVSRIRQGINIKVKLSYILTFIAAILPLTLFLQFNAVNYGSPFKLSGTVQSVDALSPDGKPLHVSSLDPASEHTEIRETTNQKTATGFFRTRNLINGLYIHLFSPDRGLIIFAPIIIVGIIGLWLSRMIPNWNVPLLLATVVANLLLYSLWGDPWGGWAFGSRYLIPAYAILAIGVGAVLDRYRRNILVLLIFAILGIYSLAVNAAGALSTSANPPQVQVLELEALSGRRERYSWDRNLEFLWNGKSKSFVYQTWFKDRFTAWQYYLGVTGALVLLFGGLTLALYLNDGKAKRRGE